MAGVDVVNRMEDRTVYRFCIGRNSPSCHPVVAVQDQSALMLGADRLDDMVDDLPLEFHCIEKITVW